MGDSRVNDILVIRNHMEVNDDIRAAVALQKLLSIVEAWLEDDQ